LILTNSALEVDGLPAGVFSVNGAVSLDDGSETVVYTTTGVGSTGKLNLTGGSLTLYDYLTLTNAGGQFIFDAGTLTSPSTTVSNGQPFTVGDAIDPATFELADGFHSFANNLRITSNAFLTGCGHILNGNVDIDPGGTVVANCGSALTFGGVVTNNGVIRVVNGSVLALDNLVVNNGVLEVLDGSYTTNNVINFGTLITGASIPQIKSLLIAGTNALLRFTTGNTAPYVVEYKSTLTATNWTPLTNFTGTGATLTITNVGAAPLPARFYRVRLPIP
jgi:hypothetical protein